MLKLSGEAIGHRPLLTLGVLLVVVGVQLLSLGLVSELVASHHEERSGGRTASCTWTRSCAELRVLYFGTYERDYPRNAQVISCLRGAGVEVVERHVASGRGGGTNGRSGSARPRGSALAEVRLLAGGRRERFDAVDRRLSRSTSTSPSARLLARGRPLVFNPLVSLHETLVEDRGRFATDSPAARVLRGLDRFALRRADLVVADTEQNARYLATLGGLPPERVAVCFVGAEERVFTPGWSRRRTSTRLFVGKLIPLHGLETILAAARLAPEIPFRIVGSGQLDAAAADRPAERRVGPLGRLRAAAGRAPPRPAARSASSGRRRRRRA